MTKTQRRVKAIQIKMAQLRNELEGIQESCPHNPWEIDVKHGCSTGNYDPSCDRYWTNCHCRVCDKTWTEEGSSIKAYSSKEDYENSITKDREFGRKFNRLVKELTAPRLNPFFHKNHTDW